VFHDRAARGEPPGARRGIAPAAAPRVPVAVRAGRRAMMVSRDLTCSTTGGSRADRARLPIRRPQASIPEPPLHGAAGLRAQARQRFAPRESRLAIAIDRRSRAIADAGERTARLKVFHQARPRRSSAEAEGRLLHDRRARPHGSRGARERARRRRELQRRAA
jgi:hypothetical protein